MARRTRGKLRKQAGSFLSVSDLRPSKHLQTLNLQTFRRPCPALDRDVGQTESSPSSSEPVDCGMRHSFRFELFRILLHCCAHLGSCFGCSDLPYMSIRLLHTSLQRSLVPKVFCSEMRPMLRGHGARHCCAQLQLGLRRQFGPKRPLATQTHVVPSVGSVEISDEHPLDFTGIPPSRNMTYFVPDEVVRPILLESTVKMKG